MQVLPVKKPTRVDYVWGAEVFALKGNFMRYGTSVAVRIHSTDRSLVKKLLETFGGHIQSFGTTLQWRLAGGPMQEFLTGLRPALKQKASSLPDYENKLAVVEEALRKLVWKKQRKEEQFR